MRLLPVVLAGLLAACATPLGTQRTAAVLPPGRLEVALAVGSELPVEPWLRLAPTMTDETSDLLEKLLSGRSIKLNTSTRAYLLLGEVLSFGETLPLTTEVTIRAGIFPAFDMSVRLTPNAWGAEAFAQVYDKGGWKVALGGGTSYGLVHTGVLGALDGLGLFKLSTVDFSMTLLAGYDWPLAAFYFGPKAMLSLLKADGWLARARSLNVHVLGLDVEADTDLGIDPSHRWLIGGVVGGRIGVERIGIALEVAVYESLYEPTLLGVKLQLGGLVVFPSFSIVGRF